MDAQWVAAVVDGGIPIVAGVVVTAMGFRAARASADSSDRRTRWMRAMRWIGPLCTLFGIVSLIHGISTASRWEWRAFTTPAGNLRADFPGVPEAVTIEQPTPVGALTLHRFAVTKGGRDFGISYRTYSPEMRAAGVMPAIDQLATSLGSANGNTLVSTRTVNVSGHDGREVVADNPAGFRVRVRAVIVGDSLYTAIATSPRDGAEHEHEDRFLDSLRVLTP